MVPTAWIYSSRFKVWPPQLHYKLTQMCFFLSLIKWLTNNMLCCVVCWSVWYYIWHVMLCFSSNKKDRRFLVIDVLQLILVEPDSKRLGWGVVRFVGFLQVCSPVLLSYWVNAFITWQHDGTICRHWVVIYTLPVDPWPFAYDAPTLGKLFTHMFLFIEWFKKVPA